VLLNAVADTGLVSALTSSSPSLQPSLSMADRIASLPIPLERGPAEVAGSGAASSISSWVEELANTLAGAIMAIKRTYRPSVVRKKRTHGFLHRNSTTSGQKLLKRRIRKGRKTLCP
jgi:large subunit ribosomal protein L34